MQISLQGHHALVGGASRGIGQAAAIALASAGASCTLLSRSGDALAQTREALDTSHGQDHHILVADQSALDSLRQNITQHLAQHPAQIWINNTGGPKGGPLHEASVDQLEAAYRQHIGAAQVILQAILPGMRAAAYGRIINVVSTSVKQPIPGLGVSNTIRGAMGNWAKTLAAELGPDGITVNNILPGFTGTGRLDEIISARAEAQQREPDAIAAGMKASVPAGRFAEPRETAEAITFLASPLASYINGINLPVDGGRTKSL